MKWMTAVGLFLMASLAQAASVQVLRAFPKLRFDKPVLLTPAPDDPSRLYVVEQTGKIKIFAQQDKVTEAKTLIDLSSVLSYGGEMGLLGLAFPPDFAKSREFYVSYTADGPRRLEIARLKISTSDAMRADPASRQVVLSVPKTTPLFSNHNGGMIVFGPDGHLYIGTGDGGGFGDRDNNSQDPMQLLGKVLRIHPQGHRQYEVPADNPFVEKEGVRPEIWSLGLRNPWRFSFDAATGHLWLADVGQNAWEEINLLKKGRNYGWNLFEGRHDYKNPKNLKQTCPNPEGLRCFDPPIFEYAQKNNNRSITGGHVYRGKRVPQLKGHYIYGDYVSGRIWALKWENDKVVSNKVLFEDNPLTQSVTAFGQDAQGELYIVSHQGTLGRLEPR